MSKPASGRLEPAVNGIARKRVTDIQRSRILAAMAEVCAERGAANATVAHIVERAGVSRRTFYQLYRDREECFLGAFDEGVARASRYVLDSYDPEATWAERLRTALISMLGFLEVEHGIGELLIVGSLGAGACALERRQRVLALMIAAVDEGRSENGKGGELPPLTAEGVVGGLLAVLHSRLLKARVSTGTRGLRGEGDSLIELTGPLMAMVVLPYLGAAASRRELKRPVPAREQGRVPAGSDPLRDVQMRLTYRTLRVLISVAEHPRSSNRELGLGAGIQDQGQISKLLSRLQKLGLIENTDVGQARGAPNAWMLTVKGQEIERAVRGWALVHTSSGRRLP